MTRRNASYLPLARYHRLFYALVVSNGVSVLLFLLRSVESQTDRYWFLLWNLFLAWLPLLFGGLLVWILRRKSWFAWQSIVLSLLWLAFLPNSFYLISDLLHIHETGEVSILYDIVMFSSLIFNACVAGFVSVYIVHRELLRRIPLRKAHAVILGVLLLCSFAIYLGRSLRWNSWDALMSPAGILFDVSDRIMNPGLHPQAFVTTATFFLLLSSIYLVLWEILRVLKIESKGK